jgi:hypothetical protein
MPEDVGSTEDAVPIVWGERCVGFVPRKIAVGYS